MSEADNGILPRVKRRFDGHLFVGLSHQFDDLDFPVVDRSLGLELPRPSDVHAGVISLLDDFGENGSELVTGGDVDVGGVVSCHGDSGPRESTKRSGMFPHLHRL